jgi:acetyl-CoA acetyltransferase family protein
MIGTRRVAVVNGVRTPFCKAWTELARLPAQELGRIAVREAIERSGLDASPRPGRTDGVDEVIVGNIASPYDAANVARVIALKACLPKSVPAYTVNRNCGSALQAIADGAFRIAHGAAEVIVAAGVESMSQIPLLYGSAAKEIFLSAARAKGIGQRLAVLSRFRPRHFKPVIALEAGLTDPISSLNMGQTAEVLAREWTITRDEQDRMALESHRRVTRSWNEGRLVEEVVPVAVGPRYDRVVERDNGHRENQSFEALSKLRPYFDRRFGTVTAGNASQITDGAAALVLASEDAVRERGLQPLGWIRSQAFAACDPERMGLGPAYATPRALAAAGVALKDIGLVEINEAFAAQVLACVRALDSDEFCRNELGLSGRVGLLDPDRTNVNGGAIALGHPVGASGARLVLTLLLEMRRRGVELGLATLCIGGGQGGAMILERGGAS